VFVVKHETFILVFFPSSAGIVPAAPGLAAMLVCPWAFTPRLCGQPAQHPLCLHDAGPKELLFTARSAPEFLLPRGI